MRTAIDLWPRSNQSCLMSRLLWRRPIQALGEPFSRSTLARRRTRPTRICRLQRLRKDIFRRSCVTAVATSKNPQEFLAFPAVLFMKESRDTGYSIRDSVDRYNPLHLLDPAFQFNSFEQGH